MLDAKTLYSKYFGLRDEVCRSGFLGAFDSEVIPPPDSDYSDWASGFRIGALVKQAQERQIHLGPVQSDWVEGASAEIVDDCLVIRVPMKTLEYALSRNGSTIADQARFREYVLKYLFEVGGSEEPLFIELLDNLLESAAEDCDSGLEEKGV